MSLLMTMLSFFFLERTNILAFLKLVGIIPFPDRSVQKSVIPETLDAA